MFMKTQRSRVVSALAVLRSPARLTLTVVTLLTAAALGGTLSSWPSSPGASSPLSAQSPDDSVAADRAALMAFYESTGGPNWTDHTNWGSNEPLFAWYGVGTDRDGRITDLRLPENNLRGTLPAALGDLANLHELWLDGNQLSGPIPATLGNLANLQYLWLNGNQLSGPIPAALGNLANMRELRLYDNQLSGPIPAALGNLANMRELRLDDNQLSGPIPASLGNLANLEGLWLENNQLSGPIPATLGNLASLERLRLYGNRLSGEIPAVLGDLILLRGLNLFGNQLTGPIPPTLGNIFGLSELILDDNQLTGPIPAALGDLADLQILTLSNNQLTGPIPVWLGDLANLQWLHLHNNSLDGPIPASLGNLHEMQLLRLAGNGLTGCVPHNLRYLLAETFFHWPAQDFLAVDANGDGDVDDEGDTPGVGLPFCLLRDLQLENATLEPSFTAGTVAYDATVASEIAETALTAALHDAGDAVIIRKGGERYASGAALPLDPGPNAITVEVVPQDDAPTRIITITVTRESAEEPSPITLDLREGGDIVAVPAGAATTAADLFGGTDVASVWKYNRATRRWDLSYLPARDRGGFPIEPGDVLWVVAPAEQTLPVAGTRPSAPAASGPITLELQEGGDIVAVPAGAATTAADLFGGTDVASVWKYNRATRRWDLSYLPARDRGGFSIEPGDMLWVVSPRAQTVGG